MRENFDCKINMFFLVLPLHTLYELMGQLTQLFIYLFIKNSLNFCKTLNWFSVNWVLAILKSYGPFVSSTSLGTMYKSKVSTIQAHQ